jgi:hypothetical protein
MEGDAMPANGSRPQGRIPWWAYATDDGWLGYMWDFYGWPGYLEYPEEFDEGVKEERADRRAVRVIPDAAAASHATRPALSRLLLAFVARFKRARPPRAASVAARGRELSLGADRP